METQEQTSTKFDFEYMIDDSRYQFKIKKGENAVEIYDYEGLYMDTMEGVNFETEDEDEWNENEKKLTQYIRKNWMAKGGEIPKGLYTKSQLLKKYSGKFIDTYPHHYSYQNPETHDWETVWEVRGVSKTIRENYETPEEVVDSYAKGGEVDQYKGKKSDEIWNNWTSKQRKHFLKDHNIKIYDEELWSDMNYDKMKSYSKIYFGDYRVIDALDSHRLSGQYSFGGSMGKGGEIADIEKFKRNLIKKAKSKGLYENFGQAEVRKLTDKYGYTEKVGEFDNWAMNFDLSQMAKGGEIEKEYEVFRDGKPISAVETTNEQDAIEQAQERWIWENFGEYGAMTDYERSKEKDFFAGKFTAKETGYAKGGEITDGQLNAWWGELPFEAKEKIHGIDLFSISENEIDDVLGELREDWDLMDVDVKREYYNELHEKYADYTMAKGGDISEIQDEWFDELAEISEKGTMLKDNAFAELEIIANSEASKKNLESFEEVAKRIKNDKIKAPLLKQIQLIKDKKHDYRFTYGGRRGDISKVSATSGLFDSFHQAFHYGGKYAKGGNVNYAGRSKHPVGTKIKIKRISGEDSDLSGLTGTLTHAFGFSSGDVGVRLDKKGVRAYDIINLYNREYKVIKADGGDIGLIPNDYGDMPAEDIWNLWNEEQRGHFLSDHVKELEAETEEAWEVEGQKVGLRKFYAIKEFDDLPETIKEKIREHISEGRYAKGGEVSEEYKKLNLKEGDDYWVIDNGKIVYSVYDDVTEELIELGEAGCPYKTELEAKEALEKMAKSGKTNGLQPTDYGKRNYFHVWEEWNVEQRKHFLKDHLEKKDLALDMYANLAESKISILPIKVVKLINEHILEGRYDKGGEINPEKKWDSLSPIRREHLLEDHLRSGDDFVSRWILIWKYQKFEVLPNHVQAVIKKHYSLPQYKQGGKISSNYGDMSAEGVWDLWNRQQRKHFLSDHVFKYSKEKYADRLKYVDADFDELSNEIRAEIKAHIVQGRYAKGGEIEKIEIVGYPEGNIIYVNEKEFEKLREMDLITFDPEWTPEKPEGQWGFENEDEEKIEKFLGRPILAKGGEITAMSPKEYLEFIDVSALTKEAQKYVESEVLTDPDLELLGKTDEDFIELKNLISESYSDAIKKEVEEPEEEVEFEPKEEVVIEEEIEEEKPTPTKKDYEDALSGLEIMLETVKGKEKKQYKDAAEGLKIMLETV